MPVFFRLIFVFLLIIASLRVDADTLLIPDAIFDGVNEKPLRGLAILVSDGRIVRVAERDEFNQSDMQVMELPGQTILPGLIDLHSHVLLHPYDETSWNDQVLKESWAERALRAGNHLEATLRAGYTTLRDLGSEGAGYVDVGVKQALQKGVIAGPRLIVAGRAIVATGSYGPKGFGEHVAVPLGAEPADGVSLISVTRDQIGNGADFIKVYADYRWGPNGEARATFSEAEIRTIVETARSSGRYTVAHASTPEAMRRATLAGVETIEHGSMGTADIFALMRDHGVAWCPTLAAGEAIAGYRGWIKGQGTEPKRIVDQKAAFAAALASGVTICAGSDVGVFAHGDNVRELELMVEYGLSPARTLQSATSVNAALLHMGDEIGKIAAGYRAELIAVAGNPLDDISVLRNVTMVMQGDHFVDMKHSPPVSPVE